ncbi:MAG: winged helix-turn-helix domain-containing protein [Methanomassiliicoccales archaeon]
MANDDAALKAEVQALRAEVARLAESIDKLVAKQSPRAKEKASNGVDSKKELSTLKAWRTYTTFAEMKHKLEALPEKEIVERFLDPISNPYRMQILKLLLSQSRTFSEISSITGMKGGNLLFHLQKLVESGMVAQRFERGDYLLTDKGLNVLEALSDLYEEER